MQVDFEATKKRIETNRDILLELSEFSFAIPSVAKATALLSFWNGEKPRSIAQASYYPLIEEDFLGFITDLDKELKTEVKQKVHGEN